MSQTKLLVAILLGLVVHSAQSATQISPAEGSVLFSRYAYFQWIPVDEASVYELQIANDEGNDPFDTLVQQIFDETHATIVKEGLEFGRRYAWRTRAYDLDMNASDWSDLHRFSLTTLADSLMYAFTPDTITPELMQPGLSLITPYGVPAIIESDGKVVTYFTGEFGWWGAGQWDFRQTPDGNFSTISQATMRLFNIQNETLWSSQGRLDAALHHCAYQKSDGNFIALTPSYRWLGEGENRRYWKADDIIEFTREGKVVWRWTCWDYLSTEDIEMISWDASTPDGVFDWTHCNSCEMDKEERFIYLSVRNLSRVLKIAYPSGDLVWSMGEKMASGDADFGDTLELGKQHSVKAINDDHLILFDNHWRDSVSFSRGMIIEIDTTQAEPARTVWEFWTEFSVVMGSVEMQPNGNMLINTGWSFDFFEVTREGEVVWAVHPDLAFGSYEIRRIPSLFPLALTMTGPVDSSVHSSGASYVQFRVNNEGEQQQRVNYTLSDSRNWLTSESGSLDMEPGSSRIITAFSDMPLDSAWDKVSLILEPVVSPVKSETLTVHLWPGDPTSILDENASPEGFEIASIYPNPFNQATNISFYFPTQSKASLTVIDAYGRQLTTLLSGKLNSGKHSVIWNADNWGAGTYFIVLETPAYKGIQKVVLMK